MACPNCKAPVDNADNFCMHCGTKLKKTCNCWVKKKDNYDCGKGICPGIKIFHPERAGNTENFCITYKDIRCRNKRTNHISAKVVCDSKENAALLQPEIEMMIRKLQQKAKHHLGIDISYEINTKII